MKKEKIMCLECDGVGKIDGNIECLECKGKGFIEAVIDRGGEHPALKKARRNIK